MDLTRLQKNLEALGYTYRYFPTAQGAVGYLTARLAGKTIGIGGSVSIDSLGLYEKLSEQNTVHWHWKTPGPETLAQAAQAQVYLTSVNAIAETGELLNIDGTGNRISAALGAHELVCYLVGINKVAEDFDKALWRARNVAAPLNARRLQRKTPCALKEELKCYNCKSPDRICNGLSVLWRPMGGVQETQVILVGEELGY
ncbi:MAG: lactate utilization protein [Clostridiales bacterium]|nr:lactate utilization protein [Clostridiales bacterium]MDY4173593.1 lactate utilization protein [Evtepia sp.]